MDLLGTMACPLPDFAKRVPYICHCRVSLSIEWSLELILTFISSFVTARRRRKAGIKPFTGTAWVLGRTPEGHAPAEYNMHSPRSNSNAPPPRYTANSNNDIELSQPKPIHTEQV